MYCIGQKVLVVTGKPGSTFWPAQEILLIMGSLRDSWRDFIKKWLSMYDKIHYKLKKNKKNKKKMHSKKKKKKWLSPQKIKTLR